MEIKPVWNTNVSLLSILFRRACPSHHSLYHFLPHPSGFSRARMISFHSRSLLLFLYTIFLFHFPSSHPQSIGPSLPSSPWWWREGSRTVVVNSIYSAGKEGGTERMEGRKQGREGGKDREGGTNKWNRRVSENRKERRIMMDIVIWGNGEGIWDWKKKRASMRSQCLV